MLILMVINSCHRAVAYYVSVFDCFMCRTIERRKEEQDPSTIDVCVQSTEQTVLLTKC